MTLIEASTSAKRANVQASPPPGALAVEDGIAWLRLDDPGKRVNTLSTRLMGWFEEQIGLLAGERPQGLVIYSGKPDTFVAGADLEELLALEDKESVIAMLERGHELMERLAGLPFPTVAAIHGACLGGGLELALACRRRVATEHREDEARAPRGAARPHPRRRRHASGCRALDRRARRPRPDPHRQAGGRQEGANGWGWWTTPAIPRTCGRPRSGWSRASAPKVKRPLATRRGRLPGPHAAGRQIRVGQGPRRRDGEDRRPLPGAASGHRHRARGVEAPPRAGLSTSKPAPSLSSWSPDTAKNLISIFFTKNDVEARAAKLGRRARPTLPETTVGILGAGFMGAGIAQVLAQKGLSIILKDKDLAAVGRGYAFCQQQLRDRVKRRRSTEAEAKAAMGRILPDGRVRRAAAGEGGGRGRVREPGGQALGHPGDRGRGTGRPDLRLQHLVDPHLSSGRGEPAAGERGGHALLQPGGEDAAGGGDPPPRHLGGDPGHHRGAGADHGQDRDRGGRRPGLLHQPGARHHAQRGGLDAGRGREPSIGSTKP